MRPSVVMLVGTLVAGVAAAQTSPNPETVP